MEERNVDFEIPLSREQWRELGENAKALGPSGFTWNEQDPDRIHVYLREQEARGIWSRLVSDEETYGTDRREIAQFVFNDGRPFAHLEAPPSLDEPAITSDEETALELGQERWVRDKWHYLLDKSGIHFESGYSPAREME
jgi:hypothetical protein